MNQSLLDEVKTTLMGKLHKSPMDEVVLGIFDFSAYWEECEINCGKKMTYEEVKAELQRDLTLGDVPN